MASIEIRELEYFAQTAKDGNISTAARKLYISHQTLSKALMGLERTMGAPLFERSQNGVRLTDFGEQLLEKAQVVLKAESECEKLASSYRDGTTGTVSVGIMASCFMETGGPIDGKKMMAFGEKHPHVQIDFIDQTSDSGLSAILDSTLDLFIHDTFLDVEHFDGVILHEDALALIVSKENHLSHRPVLSFPELKDATFALPAHNEDFRRYVSDRCHESGFEMKTWTLRIGLANWAKMVADNDVVVILPLDRAWRTVSTENVAVIPLIESGHPICAPLYLLWLKGHPLSGAKLQMRDMLVELYRDAYPE